MALQAKEMQAVHLEGDSAYLSVPSAPFEEITVVDAMKEDAPNWKRAILAELRAL